MIQWITKEEQFHWFSHQYLSSPCCCLFIHKMLHYYKQPSDLQRINTGKWQLAHTTCVILHLFVSVMWFADKLPIFFNSGELLMEYCALYSITSLNFINMNEFSVGTRMHCSFWILCLLQIISSCNSYATNLQLMLKGNVCLQTYREQIQRQMLVEVI